MTIEDIQFFKSEEGLDLIEKYKDVSDKELEMLAFSFIKKGVPHFSYLITLLKLRRKAKDKFQKADRMFFDTPSLEMATSEKIGVHIANRFQNMQKVVDLTCGIGGNALFLAKKSTVVAVDLESKSIEMAKYNSIVYGVENKIEFRVGNAFFNIDNDANAYFLDPMRSREGASKTRSFLNAQPNIVELIPRLFKVTKNICVKVSPAFDYKELELLPEMPEIEIISENNENKVALLWFGDFVENKRKATLFLGDEKIEVVSSSKKIEIPILDCFEKYILEPNLAIIKAHLIDEVAGEYDLAKVNKSIAFLTKNSLENIDLRKFRTFELIKYAKYSIKNLKKDLREMDVKYVSVINRGTPIEPERLIKELKIKEGNGAFVLLFKYRDEKNYYAIVKRI